MEKTFYKDDCVIIPNHEYCIISLDFMRNQYIIEKAIIDRIVVTNKRTKCFVLTEIILPNDVYSNMADAIEEVCERCKGKIKLYKSQVPLTQKYLDTINHWKNELSKYEKLLWKK